MPNVAGDNWDRIQEIFLEALDLPSEGQACYLDAACGADAELRADVESLLRASPADDWLSNAVGSQALALLRGSSLSGARLGAYRVIPEISQGSTGAIYLAERADDEFHKPGGPQGDEARYKYHRGTQPFPPGARDPRQPGTS
jgi:eukaryotic-like serine/threonine-protein kinase